MLVRLPILILLGKVLAVFWGGKALDGGLHSWLILHPVLLSEKCQAFLGRVEEGVNYVLGVRMQSCVSLFFKWPISP